MAGGKAAKVKVIREIRATEKRRDEALAAGDTAEVHRLEKEVEALWTKMGMIRSGLFPGPHGRDAATGQRPHVTQTGAAQIEVLEALGVTRERHDAARAAGDHAEVRRLEKEVKALRAKMDELCRPPTRASRSGRPSGRPEHDLSV